MFVRASGNTRFGERNIGHDGMKLHRQLVVAKQLAQPAPAVMIFFQRQPNDAVDIAWVKFHDSLRKRSTKDTKEHEENNLNHGEHGEHGEKERIEFHSCISPCSPCS